MSGVRVKYCGPHDSVMFDGVIVAVGEYVEVSAEVAARLVEQGWNATEVTTKKEK